jgi:uncharacterized protein (TIGR03067 family)
MLFLFLRRCFTIGCFVSVGAVVLAALKQAPPAPKADDVPGNRRAAKFGRSDFGDGRFEAVVDDPAKGLKVDGLIYDPTCLAEDKKGGFWIGLEAFGVVRFADNELRLFNAYNAPIPDSGIRDILVDRDNVKWICTNRGFLCSYDERRPVAERWQTHIVDKTDIDHPFSFRCLRQDPGGVIWVLCERNGLMQVDEGRLKLRWKQMNVHSMDIDAEGEIWLATSDGVHHGRGDMWEPLPESLFGTGRTPGIGNVYCDGGNGAVFFTTNHGLYRYHMEKVEPWTKASHGLSHDLVATVTGDRRGKLILGYGSVGSTGLGASVFDGDAWEHHEPTPSRPLWLVDSLIDSAGKAWLLSRDGSLYVCRGRQLVRALRRLRGMRADQTLAHQTPWRRKSLEDLLREPTVDAAADDIINRPQKLYGRKIRVIGKISSGFEYANLVAEDGKRIGVWPAEHSELSQFLEDSKWLDRLAGFKQREFVGYLEFGGYFGNLGANSRQFFIVEDYPEGNETAKAELKRDLNVWIEQHRAENRIWPEPHTERRVADLRALQGKWDLVSHQRNGRFDDAPPAASWIIRWDRLTWETDLSRSGYQVGIAPERPLPAISIRQPNHYLVSPAVRRGIYELQGDRLRVKFSTDGGRIPTNWTTSVDENAEILTFERDSEYTVELDRSLIQPDGPDWDIALMSVGTHIACDAFGRIAGIQFRRISNEKFHAPLRDEHLPQLETLEHLGKLNIESGQITDTGLASIGKMTSLEFLALGSDRISDAGLAQLKSLRNLKSLFVASSKVRGEFLAELADLPNLISLDLSQTRLNDEAIRHLASMAQLRYLTLPATCGDKGLAHLSELSELRELTLLGDVSDTGLSHLRLNRKKQLRTLRIAGAGVSDRGLQVLAELNNLKTLELRGTSAGTGAISSVSRCTRLRELTIEPVHVDNDDLRPLSNLRSLFYLSLTGDAGVSAAGLEHLSSLSTLWGLRIGGGQFDTNCIPPLKKLPNLRILSFTDREPREEVLVELKSALPDVEIR